MDRDLRALLAPPAGAGQGARGGQASQFRSSNPQKGAVMTVASSVEELTLTVTQEIRVPAPPESTFAALLEQLGAYNETPDGNPMPMVLEAWPGGRWYRDLGDGNGHFWANVQAIKRPTLL